jgi:hypothetical protein
VKTIITINTLGDGQFAVSFDEEGLDEIVTFTTGSPQRTIMTYLKDTGLKGKRGRPKGSKNVKGINFGTPLAKNDDIPF